MPRTDWTCWLRQKGPVLVLFARQYVQAPADSEDAVQEAFLRFWRSGQQADDPEAYIFACLRRVALDFRKSDRRRQARESRASAGVPDGLFDAPNGQAEVCEAVETALHGLPVEQREVLVLKIWADMTFEQIARALAIPLGTAFSRYRYALEKMKDLLDGLGA